MDNVRIFRILEYYGPRSQVEHGLRSRAVKGERYMGSGSYIKEAFLGEVDFPFEEVEEVKEDA